MKNSIGNFGTRAILIIMNGTLIGIGFIAVLLLGSPVLVAQKSNSIKIKSPDGVISVNVDAGTKLLWSVQCKGQQIIAPSVISLQLEGGIALGDNAKILSSHSELIDAKFTAINYKKAIIPNQYNQLTLNCKDDYGVTFRVYNEGVAYRFSQRKKESLL